MTSVLFLFRHYEALCVFTWVSLYHWTPAIACCLMAPCHYQNQCWYIIGNVECHSSEGASPINLQKFKIKLKCIYFKIHSNIRGWGGGGGGGSSHVSLPVPHSWQRCCLNFSSLQKSWLRTQFAEGPNELCYKKDGRCCGPVGRGSQGSLQSPQWVVHMWCGQQQWLLVPQLKCRHRNYHHHCRLRRRYRHHRHRCLRRCRHRHRRHLRRSLHHSCRCHLASTRWWLRQMKSQHPVAPFTNMV